MVLLLLLVDTGALQTWEISGGPAGVSRPWELGLALLFAWVGRPVVGLLSAAAGELIRLVVAAVALEPMPWVETAHFLALVVILTWWTNRLRRQLLAAEEQARHDLLTDLPNRRALEESLAAEIGRAARFEHPLVVALLDCDGFKELNDRAGHAAGDEALRRIGQLLRRELRCYDGVFRLGGDEFVIVLPETDRAGAEHACERLRTAFTHEIGRTFPGLTASLGVAVFPSPPADVAECLHRADEIMYRAKALGPGEIALEEVSGTPVLLAK